MAGFARRQRRAVACAALGCFSAAAQAPEDVRVALVIGNAAYAGAAALANPTNDATAMTGTLRTLGFNVHELKDGSREQMHAAVARVRDALRGKKGIGMLYYAGHGLQVDFRNYMVPVNAQLAGAADVARAAVDVGDVIDAFKTAATRMNIVVLDACRDNPFARTGSGKGLAPVDAPSGTFLAYATAPGNVAEDGDAGAGNGLYTGYLVKELQKPAAKIEDVFKRVRLQVRQHSKGRQIPWESTSLEDDFYFNDGVKFTFKPEDLQQLSAAARAREVQLQKVLAEAKERERQDAARKALAELQAAEAQRLQDLELAATQAREADRLKRLSAAQAREEGFRAEKADWDRIGSSRNPDDFYAFLKKYPSGMISEHATAVLERLQAARVQAMPARDAPPQAPARDRFRLGDVLAYDLVDGYSKRVIRSVDTTIAKVTDETVTTDTGVTVFTREGAVIQNSQAAKLDPPRLDMPSGDYAVGKRWSYRSLQTSHDGRRFFTEGNVKITALEDVTIGLGTFKAYKVELEGVHETGERVRLVRWFRPDWGFPLKQTREIRPVRGAATLESYEMKKPQRAG